METLRHEPPVGTAFGKSPAMSLTKVLCVDDEPQVIDGLAVHLRREYTVTAAHSGAEGLDKLKAGGPFAVVLSDMRMPGMDGATFLAEVRTLAPETVRMLLTGNTDQQTAIAAVNEGQIFRFLSKPCPPEKLRAAFKAAAEQHRLIMAERVLLEQTLHGSIQALVNVLSLTNPVSFGRAMRIKKHVSDLVDQVGLNDRWQAEVAAMLSQIAHVTLPPETAEKLYYGQPLSDEEKEMAARLPKITEQLLGHIPRMEGVREILAKAGRTYVFGEAAGDTPEKRNILRAAQILKIASDYDALETQGASAELAMDTLRGRSPGYAPEILEAFAVARNSRLQKAEVRELPVTAIREGMILAEDIRLSNGTLIASRGYEVTASFVERAQHFRAGHIKKLIRVVVRAGAPCAQ